MVRFNGLFFIGHLFFRMSEALKEIWSHMSLTEEEKVDVFVEKEWVDDISLAGKKCLFKELMLRKMVNMKVMKNVFLKIWKISFGFTIRGRRKVILILL